MWVILFHDLKSEIKDGLKILFIYMCTVGPQYPVGKQNMVIVKFWSLFEFQL